MADVADASEKTRTERKLLNLLQLAVIPEDASVSSSLSSLRGAQKGSLSSLPSTALTLPVDLVSPSKLAVSKSASGLPSTLKSRLGTAKLSKFEVTRVCPVSIHIYKSLVQDDEIYDEDEVFVAAPAAPAQPKKPDPPDDEFDF